MFQSVPHLLFNTIENYPKNDALRIRRNDEIQVTTYEQFGEQIEHIFCALHKTGLQAGDKIAILSNNMPEWTITDFATLSLGGIVVPLYQTLPPNQIAYILKDSGARAIFVQDKMQLDKIEQIQNELPNLEFVFLFAEENDRPKDVQTFSDLLKIGSKYRTQNPDLFRNSLDRIDAHDTCSLVYTSGTTGEPKGVMLNHKGFIEDIISSEAVLNLVPEDIFLSFLPLSHLYERLAGHWCAMYRGGTVHYARSIETVVEDIADAKPSIMVSVPRLYEKIANAVRDQIELGSWIKRNIFYWSIGTGLEYHEKRIEGTLTPGLERKYQLAEKLVFNKIKAKLGGNFRHPIAGGAPLSVETLKFFEAIGLRIVEGYGMTETHLIITLTPAGKTKYGSCGKPVSCVDLKISNDGEVLVKGETLMSGYYNKPDLTAEIIDEDGWLHTGDVGYLDEDNYLFLTDRKKNIIVTSGGKNIAPAPVEHKLKISKYIDDVCVIGNKRKFVSALIIPNYEIIQNWATENGIPFSNNEEMVVAQNVIDLMQKEIDEQQAEFARYEKVKKFIILAEPLTVDAGELTPSLKIKRNVIEKKYKKQIDALYI